MKLKLEQLLPREVWQNLSQDQITNGEALLTRLLKHLNLDGYFDFCMFLNEYSKMFQSEPSNKEAVMKTYEKRLVIDTIPIFNKNQSKETV